MAVRGAEAESSARSRVLLAKGFEIHPDRPCPELASPGGSAFVAFHRSFATVFEQPRGQRLVAAPTQRIEALGEDELTRVVLPPLVASLRDFWAKGLTHRAIRPTNLFRNGSSGFKLGEVAVLGSRGLRDGRHVRARHLAQHSADVVD